jgi:hypothetical protein
MRTILTLTFYLASLTLASASDGNLAAGKKATASSQRSDEFAASLAVDGKADTRWQGTKVAPGEWLEIDLGEPTRINKAQIKPYNKDIKSYRIQYWSLSGWQDAYRGVELEKEQTALFSPVVVSRVRLLMTTLQHGEPAIDEFRLYDDAAEETTLLMGATPQNLAQGKPVTASSQYSDEFCAANAGDRDFTTRWSAGSGAAQWLELDLGEPMTINMVAIIQWGVAISKYRIQYWGENEACAGSELPPYAQFVFQPARASKLRLAIDESKGLGVGL